MQLIGFLLGWDLLRDELGRDPTLPEYAERFAMDIGLVACHDSEIFTTFDGATPSAVLDALWGWHDGRVKGSPELPIGRG